MERREGQENGRRNDSREEEEGGWREQQGLMCLLPVCICLSSYNDDSQWDGMNLRCHVYLGKTLGANPYKVVSADPKHVGYLRLKSYTNTYITIITILYHVVPNVLIKTYE